jgi:hypothetical protein
MQSTRRKVHNEDEARELLALYAGWPESFRSFCAAEGIDGRSLRGWQRRLTPALPPPALELVQFAMPARSAATYRVCVGEIAIEVTEDFHEAVLMRLLSVVAAC